MPYAIRKFPPTVYPDEAISECSEAIPLLDVLLLAMAQHGPSPPGYSVKTLGKAKDGLWQINLKAGKGRQVRVLYAPFGTDIVVFRVHKKSSAGEQQRAYELAGSRKRKYEAARQAEQRMMQNGRHGGRGSIH